MLPFVPAEPATAPSGTVPPPSPRRASSSPPPADAITLSELESSLWAAANILRGSPVDRTDWKSYILPLLFFKRVCDVWDEEHEAMLAEYGTDFPDEHRFQVPEGCHWPNNDVRDAFAAEYTVLGRLWEAVSPDPVLQPHEADYRWLTQVYVSVQPTTGTGRLIWHALGAKTLELIHRNVHVEALQDDLETLVLDEAVLEVILGSPDPKKKARDVEFKLTARLRKHMANPRFRALSERLEALKERAEQGLIESLEFLKQLLSIAHDLVAAEKDTPPAEDVDRGKAALTELFQQVKNEKTPVVVERIVADIDSIVRLVRFPGWQQTTAGEREVKHALRKTLLKYQLHQDVELFEKAYGYIRQYY
jgi:type I restriction enzyme R subunit